MQGQRPASESVWAEAADALTRPMRGIEAKANYANTALAEILPVEMEPGDDRPETPDGTSPAVLDPGHRSWPGCRRPGLPCSATSASRPSLGLR
jgi:hypothetical protein